MTSVPSDALYILHADDYPDNLEVYAIYLPLALPTILLRPVNVVSVLDGVSALKQLEQQRFDLVITDLLMGGMDGLELIQRIRNGESEVGPQSTPPTVPIIVLGSFTSDKLGALKDYARTMKVDAFLDKPSSPDDVVGHVVRILRAAVDIQTSRADGTQR